ncbi:rho GTPase-activating protein 23 [Echinops telfairi]|uniref:Rho GTPase-activating protein 23 n=1 Tax=Echinops telfairi TaxID=9371 RepID=A0AC55DU42_ECHTE|nr:rho GTPase-activating protein 23 [Echinops telfairi]
MPACDAPVHKNLRGCAELGVWATRTPCPISLCPQQLPLGPRDGCSAGRPLPWQGPRTLLLRKSLQDGFGFTLRHFIVYPPESAVHCSLKSPRHRMEPMDTIFVKNVKDDGPAHRAGLRTGDRLVKVNGESIIGKTYSQVIALIQNSDDTLELSIMPKDEDVLQLRRTGLLHALSFRDSPFGGLPAFSLAQSPPSLPLEASEPPKAARPESSPRALEPPAEERRQEVVLRQKPPTGRKAQLPPARQMNLGFGDESTEPEGSERGERPGRKVAPLATAEDSLASIPFIDEPTSPSIDLQAKHVPASAVVSSAMNSAPVLGTSPTSPTFTFALGRHYSQDCSSIKAGRRSSYLLAITTERSKSCDDGLNSFRDEGRALRRLPNRVPSLRMLRSFFTDGSLDSWGTSEDADAPSKRHSTSDLSDAAFSDVRREGWLYYKQILTKKGKMEETLSSLPQDPGCANQALISKKLNDYRKVSHSSGPKADSSPKGSRGLGGLTSELLKQSAGRVLRVQDLPAGSKDDSAAVPRTPWGINIIKKNKKVTPRAFGVRLEECQPAAENQRVPLIVAACCRIVETRGLESTGIYRVPGNNAVVSSLQEQLNRGPGDINLQDERWQDLNVISSLLKSFFRKLPEPLFTDDKYNDFIEANRIEDSRERMKTLRKLIRDLPGHYYETLKFLVGHLKTIADHSEKNKMEPRNLALVFGPTLVRTSEDNMTDMVTHMPDRYKIVETLIQHSDWFFSDEEDKGERTPVDDKEPQSVPNIEYLLPNIGRTVPPTDPGSDSTTCSSAKSKGSWAPKKEPYAREMLAISFISAVNRKRKKRREARGLGSFKDPWNLLGQWYSLLNPTKA